MIMVDLPYPPSANRLWRIRQGGRGAYRAPEYDAWQHEASWAVRAAMPRASARIDVPYVLNVVAGRPDRRQRDLDNLIKPISDALKSGGAIKDDSLAQKIEIEWQDGIEGVRVTVVPA